MTWLRPSPRSRRGCGPPPPRQEGRSRARSPRLRAGCHRSSASPRDSWAASRSRGRPAPRRAAGACGPCGTRPGADPRWSSAAPRRREPRIRRSALCSGRRGGPGSRLLAALGLDRLKPRGGRGMGAEPARPPRRRHLEIEALEEQEHVGAAASRTAGQAIEQLHRVAVRCELLLAVEGAVAAQRLVVSDGLSGTGRLRLAPLRTRIEVSQLHMAQLMRKGRLQLRWLQVAQRARSDGQPELVRWVRPDRHVDSPEMDDAHADRTLLLALADPRGGNQGRQHLVDLCLLHFVWTSELRLRRRACRQGQADQQEPPRNLHGVLFFRYLRAVSSRPLPYIISTITQRNKLS